MSIKGEGKRSDLLEKLTLVGKSAEEVGFNHLHGGLEHALLDHIVSGLWLVQQVNDLHQALLLGLFQIHVLLGIRKVGDFVAGSQLGKVQDLPLVAVDICR